MTFVGPTAAQISAFGLKHEARALAKAAGVPLLPGSALVPNIEEAAAASARGHHFQCGQLQGLVLESLNSNISDIKNIVGFFAIALNSGFSGNQC